MREMFDRIQAQFHGMNLLYSLLDIIFVSVLLYLVFVFLDKRNTSRLIKYIVIGLLVSALLAGNVLGLHMTGYLASQMLVLLFLFVIILFTPELKRGLWKISSPKLTHDVFSTDYNCSDDELRDAIDDIVRACQNMSKKNVGALMVIAPTNVPENILESGTRMDSYLSSSLLECLFNTKAPLHDGAVFIRGNMILAAGCFLPLTQSSFVDPELGTRHRAAIGMTETNNVISIIVSEETGVISVANDGKIARYYDTDMLRDTLEQIYGLKATTIGDSKKKRKGILHDKAKRK